MSLYCEIALPVPLRSTFSYVVPEALLSDMQVGSRVVVPFGRRTLVGVAVKLAAEPPDTQKLKEILEVLDPLPALPPALVELGCWVSDYYLAPPGEVFRAILPPAVEVRHDRELLLTDAGRDYFRELGSRGALSQSQAAEYILFQLFHGTAGPIAARKVRKLVGGEAATQRLLRRKLLEAREVARRRNVRTQKIVSWNARDSNNADEGSSAPITAPADGSDPSIVPAPGAGQAAPEQPEPSRRRRATGPQARAAETRLRDVLTSAGGPLPLALAMKRAEVSRAAIDRLSRQGKLLLWDEPITPEENQWDLDFSAPANALNREQQQALSEIQRWLAAKNFATALLYGVTGSGKTEVYLRAVEAALALGRTALVLVPEIALTLWMSRLARARFGEGVAVLHSTLPRQERAREWWRARRGEAKVVVGTRSAIFAPLENLGLVIVDEEQESSYKQDETPRYHGRDTAIVRAKLEGAVALLGSATPSLESFHNARSGKYRLLQLTTRVENRSLARVEVIDLREDFRESHRALALSRKLRSAIAERLAQGTQTLVLINRRGYSWYVLCRTCGASPQCQNCSISLTFHKRENRLICHYCGYSSPVPKVCPNCDSQYLYFVGEGAERIEEYLREQFPDARIGRLDRDAVRSRRAYQQVLGAFAKGELDVLVGTQMVAKGHDFHRVTLVGVVAADRTLALPDFRAAERTFQLLTQVAGRAGRGELPGEVLVESYHPDHYAIQRAARQDYPSFFEQELLYRRMMHYPPFTALANVLVRDTRLEKAIAWTRALAAFFSSRETQGLKVLGPAAAPLARLKREYRFQFLLKAPQRSRLNETLAASLAFCARKEIPERALLVDVDPMSLF